MVLRDKVDEVLSIEIPSIDQVLSTKDSLREEAIRITREILRYSTEATRLIHLENYEKAWQNIVQASVLVKKLKELLKEHPDLYYSGLVYNSLSEYAEAYISHKLIVEGEMPRREDLDVPIIPYLQGLGDVVGELRRHVITLLNRGDVKKAEEYLEAMEIIYLWLRKLNYPDPLVPGLRHKVDVARRLIEDTKVLLLNTRNAITVSEKIKQLLEKLG